MTFILLYGEIHLSFLYFIISAMFHVTQAVECAVIVPMALAFVLSLFYVTSPSARTQRVAAWIMLFSFFSGKYHNTAYLFPFID